MAPAADLVAVSVGVLVAFEAFQNVVGVGEACAHGEVGSGVRAHAAAAQEHYQRFRVHLALELGQEMGVGLVTGIKHPFEFDRARHAADPVPLGTGAHVDEPGAGGQLQDVPGFAGCQRAGVGEIQAPSTLLREGEGFA